MDAGKLTPTFAQFTSKPVDTESAAPTQSGPAESFQLGAPTLKLLTAPRIAGLLSAPTENATPLETAKAPDRPAAPSVPKTLFMEEEPLQSSALKTAAELPWVIHIQPTDCLQHKAEDDEITAAQSVAKLLGQKAATTYMMNVPGLGWGIVKPVDSLLGNPQAELLQSLIAEKLPKPPGGSGHVVPKTDLVWLDKPAPARFKDGSEGAEPAKPGLYSFQRWLGGSPLEAGNVKEYIHHRVTPGTPLHPDYIVIHYLDALDHNMDRTGGNFMVVDRPADAPPAQTPEEQDGKPYATDGGLGSSNMIEHEPDYLEFTEMFGSRFFREDGLPTTPAQYGNLDNYLTSCLEYSKEAQRALSDSVLEKIVAQVREVPEFGAKQTKNADLVRSIAFEKNKDKVPEAYDGLDFDKILAGYKFNRDHMADSILTSMQRLEKERREDPPTA